MVICHSDNRILLSSSYAQSEVTQCCCHCQVTFHSCNELSGLSVLTVHIIHTLLNMLRRIDHKTVNGVALLMRLTWQPSFVSCKQSFSSTSVSESFYYWATTFISSRDRHVYQLCWSLDIVCSEWHANHSCRPRPSQGRFQEYAQGGGPSPSFPSPPLLSPPFPLERPP